MSEVETPARGVLDTNAVILLPRLRDEDQLPRVSFITAISLAELSVGPHQTLLLMDVLCDIAPVRLDDLECWHHALGRARDQLVLPHDGPAGAWAPLPERPTPEAVLKVAG